MLDKKMLPEGDRAKILEGIGDEMGRNEKLPANSTCSTGQEARLAFSCFGSEEDQWEQMEWGR